MKHSSTCLANRHDRSRDAECTCGAVQALRSVIAPLTANSEELQAAETIIDRVRNGLCQNCGTKDTDCTCNVIDWLTNLNSSELVIEEWRSKVECDPATFDTRELPGFERHTRQTFPNAGGWGSIKAWSDYCRSRRNFVCFTADGKAKFKRFYGLKSFQLVWIAEL